MIEPKFTKGEWSIVDSTGQSLSVWASESECITTIKYDFWDEKYQDELKANAHLIASAPAMYAMISDIEKSIINCKNEIELADDITNLCHDIDQLLKKSRGE